MRFLLDTNTCISLMRGHPKTLSRITPLAPSDCAVSTVTTYELYTGVEKCARPTVERAKVDRLLKTLIVLSFDPTAAQEAAKVRATLESEGVSIGPYDLLLAGQAIALSLTLVTGNSREFARVSGLAIEEW
jgi:tRNA(fMet)-specific endonuclease VapC